MYLDLTNKNNINQLKQAAQIIKDGGIVVFPTETVYGIGANAFHEGAIKRLYEIKHRPFHQNTSLLVNSLEMIELIAQKPTPLEYALIHEFFPGPLTLIVKTNHKVSSIVAGTTNTFGVRMPQNEIALKLIEYANVPIATPSANIAGKPSGTNIKNIMEDFKEQVDCYIDGGNSKLGISSTIVQVIDEVPHILREGVISAKQIHDFCSHFLSNH